MFLTFDVVGIDETCRVRSVLRVSDQEAGRFPDVCVLSGVPTDRAVRLVATRWRGPAWMLGMPGLRVAGRLAAWSPALPVALPVTAAVWGIWQRRNIAATSAMVFGLALIGAGIIGSASAVALLGAFVVPVGYVYRTRAHRNFWVTCRLGDAGTTIIVEPTHAAFDAQARRLFVSSI